MATILAFPESAEERTALRDKKKKQEKETTNAEQTEKNRKKIAAETNARILASLTRNHKPPGK